MTGISGSLFLYALRLIFVCYVRQMETGALFDRACLRYLPSGLDRIKSFVVRKGFNPAAGVGPQVSFNAFLTKETRIQRKAEKKQGK